MADISFTPGNVVIENNTSLTKQGTAGATITAGDWLYQAADGDLEPAQANAATTDYVIGIALNGASAGQPVEYADIPGTIVDFGSGTTGLTVGGIVTLSAGAAGACAQDAIANPNYVTVLGVGTAATKMVIGIINSGAQVPT